MVLCLQLFQTIRPRVLLRVPPLVSLLLFGHLQRLGRPLYNHRLPSTTLYQRILLAHRLAGSRRPHQSQSNHPSRTSFVTVSSLANVASVVSSGHLSSRGFSEKPTRLRQRAPKPHSPRIKTLRLLKHSPYGLPLFPQSNILRTIVFNHHCQRALKTIHPRVDTGYLKIRTSDYQRCLLREALWRTRKNRGHKRHLIPTAIETLHLTDLPTQPTIPETRVEPLRADGGLVLRNKTIVWMAAGARESEPIHDVMTTVTGDQGVKTSIAGPSVGQLLAVMMTARGTVTEMLGNGNGRRTEVAETLIVSPLAGTATENEMSQAPDFLLVLLGILLGMIVFHFLVTRQAENAPVIQGTTRCVL